MTLSFLSWESVTKYIDGKFEDFLNAESRVNRRQMPDNRVHCCLYFIAPSGHGWVPRLTRQYPENISKEMERKSTFEFKLSRVCEAS